MRTLSFQQFCWCNQPIELRRISENAAASEPVAVPIQVTDPRSPTKNVHSSHFQIVVLTQGARNLTKAFFPPTVASKFSLVSSTGPEALATETDDNAATIATKKVFIFKFVTTGAEIQNPKPKANIFVLRFDSARKQTGVGPASAR